MPPEESASGRSGPLPPDGASSPPPALSPEEVRRRFEEDWRSGRRPRIEPYLHSVPEQARCPLLRHLLAAELAYRWHNGERPTCEEYALRFPEHVELI